MIVQVDALGMGVQEAVILVIINNSNMVGGGIVIIVQQVVQLVLGVMLISVRVVRLVIIFQEEIHVLHVQLDVPHVRALQPAKHAIVAIICQEPHAQHVIRIV